MKPISLHLLPPFAKKLEETLDVPFEMKGRTKSISSIHNKLRKQVFEDIYDLFAIRVIVDCPQERERLNLLAGLFDNR